MPAKVSARKRKATSAASRSKSQSFTFKQTIDASPAETFRAFTHATMLRDWFCNTAQVEARQGGMFYLGWQSGHYVSGEFLTFDPGKKLVFTWDGRGEPQPTRVSVAFTAKGDGSVVTVSHTGVGSGAKWARTVRGIQTGWAEGLENLKSVIETGIDLRYARRPRLGIFIGEFNPEVAVRLGVPAKQGIKLEGTAEGSGARSAGLQKDDVIVKLGGKAAVDSATLSRALQGRRAGDVVTVEFYRGGQKMSAPLELSKFPILDVPETAGELAEMVRKNYADLNAELEKTLEGLTEAEADHKEGEEWSVKELLAHYVSMERDFQSWVADMLNDTPVEDYLEMRPNVNERLRALVARFQTMPALLQELKQAEAETVSLLAAFPPKFLARKHLYRRAAQWMLEVVPTHFREEHGEQLKTAIGAARKK